MRFAQCRSSEINMPAIAPIEGLRAAQNDLRSMFLAVFPLQLAPYDLRPMGNGVALVGRMFASYGWKNAPRNN
jgi:hypothetical protein